MRIVSMGRPLRLVRSISAPSPLMKRPSKVLKSSSTRGPWYSSSRSALTTANIYSDRG